MMFRAFLSWWLDYPEWAAIGMAVGAAMGLVTVYLIGA